MARTSLSLAALLPGLGLCFSMVACGGDGSTTSGGGGGGGGAGGTTATTSTSATATSTGSEGGGSGTTSSTTTGEGGSTTSTTSSTSTSTSTSSTTSTGTPTGCLMDLSAGHHEVACQGGITYEVEIPAACTAGPCGLIVDMHGYTMTADSEDENTGMRALGQQHGYVVVQPTAPKDGLQLPSWDQPTHAPLVHQFLVEIASGLPIDPKRIHAMGFSQGGGMTLRLMCSHAGFFASVAPIGGLAGCEMSGQNTPSEEVDILQVHGHNDAIVSFPNVAVPQHEAILGGWPFGQPTLLEEDANHKATRWATPNGTVHELWEHDYETSAQVLFVGLKGHCVPGGTDFDGTPAGYSCEDTGTFVFGQLAMAFFQAHPKE